MSDRVIVYDDLYEVCRDQGKLLEWLEDAGVIGNFAGVCEKCGKGKIDKRKDSSKNDGYVWRCSNKQCHFKISVRHSSWFSSSKLPISVLLKLTFYWVNKCREDFVKTQLRLGSDHTLVDWYNFCREVCLEILVGENEQIGGPGVEVEIDESKFGKRKYHRGRRVDGVWVFGGIEKGSDKMFLEIVERRDAETLVGIIKKWIRPGSIIHSDCWKAYSSLGDIGYEHVTVNHSKEFLNRDNGACTNKIESTWRAVKASLPRYGTVKGLYESYFVEYIIRKKYLRSSPDPFLQFLKFISRVYNPKKPNEDVAADEEGGAAGDAGLPGPNFNDSADLFE